ncbi:MAG: hypothetical protein V3V01_01085 [Acidimicrobiales bacterium]
MKELQDLGDGVHGWIEDSPQRGRPNSGIIVDEDCLTIVDSQTTAQQSAELLAAIEPLGKEVRHLVYTTSHIEFVGGSSNFTMAAVYGTAQTSAHLDQAPNTKAYQRMFPDLRDEFDDLSTKPVSHVVTENAYISTSAIAIPIAGELAENLVVQVPHANVVFAGAIAAFGVTPNAFDGDPLAWAESLDQIVEWGQTIVPGHGPVGDRENVIALQAYLWACVEADGDASKIPAGPWDGWPDRNLDAVNVQRAQMLAQGNTSTPPAMLAMLGIA